MFGPGSYSFIPLLMFSVLLLALYLTPTVLAITMRHPHRVAVILINLLGGPFFGLGWVVALIWCFVEAAKVPIESNDRSDRKISKPATRLPEKSFNDSLGI